MTCFFSSEQAFHPGCTISTHEAATSGHEAPAVKFRAARSELNAATSKLKAPALNFRAVRSKLNAPVSEPGDTDLYLRKAVFTPVEPEAD